MFRPQRRLLSLSLCLLLFALTLAPRLVLAAQGGTPHADTQTLLDKGKQADATHDYEAALRHYTEALEKARALSDKAGEAEALRQVGVVHLQAGQPPKAAEFFEQSLAVSREAKDRPREARALNNLGFLYDNIGQPERALAYYQQSLGLHRESKDTASQALTLNNIGKTYTRLGQPDRALAAFEPALRLFRDVNNKLGEATVLTSRGVVYLDLGQPQRALDAYRQALPLFREGRERRSEAGTLENIGNVYVRLGEPHRALAFFEQALTLYQQTKELRGEASALGAIGSAYTHLRQPQSARAFFEQALQRFRDLGDRRGEAITLGNLGNVYRDLGQRQKALDLYRQARELHRRTGEKSGEAATLSGIGGLFLRVGQTKQALESFQQALALRREIGDKGGAATSLAQLALVYLDSRQPERALELQRQALPLHREVRDKQAEAATLGYMAASEKMRGRLAAAERYARQALVLLEQRRADLGGLSGAKIGFQESSLPTYYRALDVLLKRNKPADAFAVAQQTKARALLDLLAEGKANLAPRMTDAEKQREHELRREADVLNARMVAEGVRNEVGAKKRFAALKSQLARTEDALQAFTTSLYARYPELARKRVARTATLADVARFLPPDTALLEYVVLEGESSQEEIDRTVLFVVTRPKVGAAATVRAYSLPTAHRRLVANRVDAFRAACADPRKPYAKQADALYRLLLAPAAKQLAGKKRLLICPDGPLWDLPFAALHDGRRFLLERYEIAYAYSATGAQAALLAKTDKRRARPTGTLLVLANPDFGNEKRFGDTPGLPGQRPLDAPSRPLDAPSRPLDAPSRPLDAPSREALLPRGGHLVGLPGTQREANALERRFPRAAVYTGTKAQEQIVKEKAAGYRYVHLASHAFFNDAAPLLSSVVLANPPPGSGDDGFLTAREIFDLDLSAADLVVLSACNTARGEKRSGEGVIGLTWALFVAGAPTQVLSQWSVNDASTATLMERFYAKLSHPQTGKGEALRAAALSLRRDRKHAHPYYWAPFILVGDWRR